MGALPVGLGKLEQMEKLVGVAEGHLGPDSQKGCKVTAQWGT